MASRPSLRTPVQRMLYRGLVLVVATVFLPVHPALATNFGSGIDHACDTSTLSQCIANNGTHWWYPSSLTTNMWNATRYASNNVYDPVADVDTTEMTSSSNVDVIVYDSNYGTGNRAWTQCSSTATYGGSDPTKWCRPQLLKYDTSHTTWYDSTFERNHLACEEMGHTLGLRHSTNTSSCMYTDQALSAQLTSHDISHLNAQYQVCNCQGPEGALP